VRTPHGHRSVRATALPPYRTRCLPNRNHRASGVPAQQLGKLDNLAATGDLLPTPHDSVGLEASWAEPASVRGDDPRSCLRQDRSRLIESMHVLGKPCDRITGQPSIAPRSTSAICRRSSRRFYWLFIHPPFRPCAHVTMEMNARRSVSIRSGCSKAAKCPPADISLQ
jgi:hypothetical protein